MEHLAEYALPGTIFFVLGLRWACELVWEWSKRKLERDIEIERSRICPPPSLPWEGIIKLVLTGLGIILSVIASIPDLSGNYVKNIRFATIYLLFSISGLTDILVYYCGYSVLPEGIQSFILSLAFSVEGLMLCMRLRFESPLEQQIHILLAIVVFACAISCTMEVLHDNRLIKFCRAYLCLIQGTWLIHGGFILKEEDEFSTTSSDSLEWSSILFAWHSAANFILFIATLLCVRALTKIFNPFTRHHHHRQLSSSSPSRSNETRNDKQKTVERIEITKETDLRASIKLKESSLI